MQNVRPKKALGQHFLTDLNVARRIADTIDGFTDLPVVEVGPGMGVLTQFLVEKGCDLTVVEIDTESVSWLKANMPALDGHILEADFLRLDLGELFNGQKMCVIGNNPTNISSQIFFHILQWRNLVVCCSGMLQKEVAERLAAPPGTKSRGILSVLLQAWYDVEYLFTVDEHVFNPPPKVKSGVVKLTRTNVESKTLRNSLKGLPPAGAPMPDSPLLALRPEQLSVGQFIELTNIVEAAKNAQKA